MESNGLKQELVARSRISSLEELESRGRQRVKIIRADHIAELIDLAVEKALAEANADTIARSDVAALLDVARREAHEAVAVRETEIARLTADLEAANRRLAELAVLPGEQPATAPTAATPASQPASPDAAANMANAAADAIANAVDQLNSAMSDRLEKMSRKLGISTAVEADQVNFSNLFDHDNDDAPVESNLDDMRVKTKTGTGIAANLERLKKLKGGD